MSKKREVPFIELMASEDELDEISRKRAALSASPGFDCYEVSRDSLAVMQERALKAEGKVKMLEKRLEDTLFELDKAKISSEFCKDAAVAVTEENKNLKFIIDKLRIQTEMLHDLASTSSSLDGQFKTMAFKGLRSIFGVMSKMDVDDESGPDVAAAIKTGAQFPDDAETAGLEFFKSIDAFAFVLAAMEQFYHAATEAANGKALADAYNAKLVAEYDRLKAHSQETDNLFNAMAVDLENARKEVFDLTTELQQAERVMEKHYAIISELRVRLEWKNSAEKYTFTDDGKTMAELLESLTAEKRMFQTRSLRESKSVGSLSALVSGLRKENVKLREMLVDARERIPPSNALLLVDETVEAKVAKEAEKHKQSMAGDTTQGCKDCKTLWLSLRQYKEKCETLEMKVRCAQSDYLKRVDEAGEKANYLEKEVKRVQEIAKAEMDNMGVVHRRELAKVEKEKKKLEDERGQIELANTRRNKAREEDYERIRREYDELKQQADRYVANSTEAATLTDASMHTLCAKAALDLLYRVARTDGGKHQMLDSVRCGIDAANEIRNGPLANKPKDVMDATQVSIQLNDIYLALYQTIVSPSPHNQNKTALEEVLERAVTVSKDTTVSSSSKETIDVPYSSADETLWQELSHVLLGTLEPIARLADAFCGRGRWRKTLDNKFLSEHSARLSAIVRRVLQECKDDDLSMSSLVELKKAMFAPIADGKDTYVPWIVSQSIGCVGLNDHFAGSMRGEINSVHKQNQELARLNQAHTENMKQRLAEVLSQISKRSDNTLEFNSTDMLMLNSITQMAQEAYARGADVMNAYNIPEEFKGAFNTLQTAYIVLGRLCSRYLPLESATSSSTTGANSQRRDTHPARSPSPTYRGGL